MSRSRKPQKRGKHQRLTDDQPQQQQSQPSQQPQSQPRSEAQQRRQPDAYSSQQRQAQPYQQGQARPQQQGQTYSQQDYPYRQQQPQAGRQQQRRHPNSYQVPDVQPQSQQRTVPGGAPQAQPRTVSVEGRQRQQRETSREARRAQRRAKGRTTSQADQYPYSQPYSQSYSQPYGQSAYRPVREWNPTPRKRKSHRAGLIVAIIFLLLVLAGIAAAAVYIMGLNNDLSLGDDAQEVEATLSDVKVSEPFYALVLGSDSRSGDAADARSSSGQADIMLLVRVDSSSNTITLVSIPRDTPYTEDDGTIVKINHEHQNGPAATVKAVEDLTGVQVSHYAEISFTDLEDFVDYLGGVEVDVPIELTVDDPLTGEQITLEPGQQTLNGQQALAFARDRHDYVNDQDVHRQKAVREIVMAIMGKVRSQPVTELPATVKEMASCVDTDMKTGELMNLARLLTDGKVTVYSVSGPYAGDVDEYLDGEPWICYSDPDGWSNLMSLVDSGQDPSGISYVGDTVSYPGSDETFVLDENSEMQSVGDEDEAEAEAESEATGGTEES